MQANALRLKDFADFLKTVTRTRAHTCMQADQAPSITVKQFNGQIMYDVRGRNF